MHGFVSLSSSAGIGLGPASFWGFGEAEASGGTTGSAVANGDSVVVGVVVGIGISVAVTSAVGVLVGVAVGFETISEAEERFCKI